MRLADRVAVVTGAARGIGAAIAQRFAREGAFVHLLDNDVAPLEVLARDLSVEGLAAVGTPCDVSDEASVRAAVAAVLARHPHPHILVNNAGVNTHPASVTETPPEHWDQVLSTNLRGTYLVTRALVPHLTDGASVVHVASVLALEGAKAAAAYSASKGGLLALMRSMVADCSPRVRVNCLCPGPVQTEMFEAYLARVEDPEAERRRVVDALPLQRVGTVEDIANAALFLASEESSWITGHALVIDGGDSV
ncbi:MAG: glucose 1-dehydrogenase [Deltaproteobacteria bacterium]|nr:glucose 1-dehydrogenase [Deltaproteobacteria bacterium]